MAVATADLVRIYSAVSTAKLRSRLIFTQLCNRDYEAQAQGAYIVKVPTFANTVTASSYTKHADWKGVQATDVNLADLTMDQFLEVGNEVEGLDQIETMVDMVAGVADDQAYALAAGIDKNIAAAMIAGVGTGNTTDVGTSSNYIPETGVPSATAADSFVYDVIESMGLKVMTAAIGGPAAQGSPTVWAVMRPYLFRSLRTYLLSKNWGDSLSTESFRDQRVGLPRPGFVGRVAGIDLYVSNNVPDGSKSSKDQGQIICGTTRATTFASRPPIIQYLTPQTNQTVPAYYLRQIRNFGRLVTNGAIIQLGRIRQEA